ncbi:MAG: peptide chain release factor N(5)-glutamine methyltransferase [Hyphomonadaceae bacterium]
MSATIVSVWQSARDALIAAGVEMPVFDARLLLEAGAEISRLDIITDPRRPLSEAQVRGVEALVARRVAREPISRILGRKAFWTLELELTPDVLTPRPETEFLVEFALAALAPTTPARVLDLGVGSGAILLSVLTERDLASGVGVDLSAVALDVTRANASRMKLDNRLTLRAGGWDVEFGEPFDLVLSNPPYIPSGEIDALAPEVALHEPRMALDGGPDGLDAYRAIINRLPHLLKPGGAFAFEVGKGQADAVYALAAGAGFVRLEQRHDLAGIPRVVCGWARP